VEEDLVIALSVLLEVDEAAARGIAARLGLGGRLAGNQFAAGFQKAATSGTAKAAGAVGKAASSGGSQKQAGVAAGQQFVDGYKTALTQIVSVTRASLKDQSAIQRQGTKGGQVDVDAQRAALDRRTLEKRRREYELGNEYKTRNAVELADVKRHNASLIAADQQGGVRRTVLIRTMLNNMTRINQTALSGILSMWKSHQQRKLQDEASFNRKAEIDLQASMDRRLAKIKAGTQQQSLAATANASASERANTALSGGVLGAATGRGMGVASLFAGAFGGREIFNILGDFQNIETAFKGIFREVDGGAPRTTQFLKDMQAFARETPFTLSQVSLAAQKMFAARLVNPEDADATEQLTEKLRRLADAASATGKNASQMDAALLGITQIQGTGFMMEELRQVTENIGLPMDEVAKSLGMSVKEMKDAMKEGSIGVKEGLDAIFDAMTRIPGAAGASARQAKTLRGAMSQLRDVGEQLVIKFLMPVGVAFGGMALAIGKVGDQLLSGKGAWKVARDGLQGIVGALTAIIAVKGAVGVIKLLGIGLSAIAAAPVTAALVALVGVLSTFDGLRAKLASLVEGTKNWFLVGYRANVVIDSFSGFVKVITTVGKFARTIKDFTTALVVGTKDWFLVGYRISGVIDEFSNIVLFQTSLGAAARVIKDALRGIWDALGTLAKTRDFGEFRKALGKIAEDAGKALSPIKDALAKQFSKGVDAAKAAAGKAVKAVIGWVGDNMDSLVAGARVASGGALILKMLGLAKGGNFLGAAQLGIGVAIAGALIGAAKTLAKDQTAEEFGKQINDFLQKGIDRAFDAAVIIAAVVGKLGSLVGDVWGALFGGKKEGDAAADPKASLSIAAKIAATITAAWKKATENLGNLASAIGTWFTESFTGWIVDFPYEVGPQAVLHHLPRRGVQGPRDRRHSGRCCRCVHRRAVRPRLPPWAWWRLLPSLGGCSRTPSRGRSVGRSAPPSLGPSCSAWAWCSPGASSPPSPPRSPLRSASSPSASTLTAPATPASASPGSSGRWMAPGPRLATSA
jgi:tape measure domain-containing protein